MRKMFALGVLVTCLAINIMAQDTSSSGPHKTEDKKADKKDSKKKKSKKSKKDDCSCGDAGSEGKKCPPCK